MKRLFVWILLPLLLTGCNDLSDDLDAGMQLRSRLLQSEQCVFTTEISAEYDDRICLFAMDCEADENGDLAFTVVQPLTIAGISGTLTGEEGQLQFENVALQFPLKVEDLPSPISAPWILLNALRSGFLTSACVEGDEICLSIDDIFQGRTLKTDVWLNSVNVPSRADILYEGRKILTMRVKKFDIS